MATVGPSARTLDWPRAPRWNRPGRAAAFFCAATAVLIVLAIGVDLRRPFRGDEIHFQETIRQFGDFPGIDLLAHYEEMSGPLPFMVYGLWGRAFGYEPAVLRTMSILIALMTYGAWMRFAWGELGGARQTLLATACFLLQPYMLYVGLFVYTDMLAVLFLLVALIGLREGRAWLLAAGIAGALVSRQHLAFLPLAAGAFLLLRLVRQPRREDARLLAACCAGTLPLILLLALWRGPCPDNNLKHIYLGGGTRFHVDSAWLYVSMTAVYLAPLLYSKRRLLLESRWNVAVAVAIGALYWLTPIAASPASQAVGIRHVGMMHRALDVVLPAPELVQLAFWLALIPGLLLVQVLCRDVLHRVRQGVIDIPLFLDLAALAFLALMPWAYLHWEKYLLPLVPILAARLCWNENAGGPVVAASK